MKIFKLLCGLVMCVLLDGCVSPPTEPPESELPWNERQPWEGAPSIPGLEAR